MQRPLYITDHSDRLLCPLPLKCEPYSGCSGGCVYCSRSGLRSPGKVKGLQANSYKYIEKFFFRDMRCMERSLINQRCPVQVGANSDALQPAERIHKTTLRVLRMLADRSYPVVLTSKFPNRLTESEYLRILDGLPLVVQCSVSSEDPTMLKALEPGVPPLHERLKALETLHAAGAHVILRMCPYAPDLAGNIEHLLAQAKDAGVRTVQAGFLKVHHSGGCGQRINQAVGYGYLASTQLPYENHGVFSTIPLEEQRVHVERLETLCRKLGMDCLTCDDVTRGRNWRTCCDVDGIKGFEGVAKWAYYINGYRIEDHCSFEEYMRAHDCPWHAEFEQEWNNGKLERALSELIFNKEDKTYSRMW